MNDYLATINIPGYLPMDDNPPVFETARDAWEYLADERKRNEDDFADGESGYSATVNILEQRAEGNFDPGLGSVDEQTGAGTVYGDRPDLDSDHDLGLAYTVTLIEHVNYPHEPGRLIDCPACEARCHCDDDPGTTACVFDGEHMHGKTDD